MTQSGRWLCGLAALLLATQPAAGERCRTAVEQYPPGWRPGPSPPVSAAVMRLQVVASCTACEPAVFAETFAGRAPPQLLGTPLGQKTGIDFAQAVVSDAALRAAFVAEFIEAERHASPGCEVEARVDGVATIGFLPMIVTTIRAECAQAPGKIRAAYFSGYDGVCLHRVRVLWAGWSALLPETQQRIEAFLEQLRFHP